MPIRGQLVVCQDDVFSPDESKLLIEKGSHCIFVRELSSFRRGILGYEVFAPDGQLVRLGAGCEFIGEPGDILLVVRGRTPGAPMFGWPPGRFSDQQP